MNIKKIKPMYTKFVCTADKYVESETMVGGIIDASKLKMGLKEYQKVIAVGNSCRTIKEGDMVCINPDRYVQKKFSEDSLRADLVTNDIVKYNFPMVVLDVQDYLLLDEADVEFVIEDYDD